MSDVQETCKIAIMKGVTKVHDLVLAYRRLKKGLRVSWDSRLLTRPCELYATWTIGFEKAIGGMSTAFAHSTHKRKRKTTSQQLYALSTQFEAVFASFRGRRRSIDPLIYTRG